MKNPHVKHRQRLKKRFLIDGLISFEKHNVLELLLFYGIPQKDTNPLAHRLIETFGSFYGVFDASYEDLCRVKGIGPHAAALIKIIPQIAQIYLEDKQQVDRGFYSISKLCEYAKAKYIGVEEEQIIVILLDNANRLLTSQMISTGDLNSARIPIDRLVKLALTYKSHNVVLMHNHPIGVAIPSYGDITATQELKQALNYLNIHLTEHIIVGKTGDVVCLYHDGFMNKNE